FDKRTLGVRVLRPGQVRSQFAFQVVVSGCGAWMSSEIVAKGEVLNPEVASFHDTMEMNGARLMSRFVKVPSIRQLLLVFLDVLVPRGLECLNPRFNLGQRTHTN